MSGSPRIVIVDDDPDLRELLRLTLTGDGFAVDQADSGRSALHVLRSRHDVCCVLLDLKLKGMDGRQFRAAQRRDRALAWIPIVVISAEPGAADVARDLNAFAFLRKPFDLDELRRAVHQAVELVAVRAKR